MSAPFKASMVCVATATVVILLLLLQANGRRRCTASGAPLAEFIPVKRLQEDWLGAPAPAPTPSPRPVPAPKPSPPVQFGRDSTPGQLAARLRLDEKGCAGKPGARVGTAVPVMKLAAIEPFEPAPLAKLQSRRQIKLPKLQPRPAGSPLPCVEWDLPLVARMVSADAARVVVRTEDGRAWLVAPQQGRWLVEAFVSDLPLGEMAFELDRAVAGIEELRMQVERTAGSPVSSFQLVCSIATLEAFKVRQIAALESVAATPRAVALTAGTIQWEAGQPVYVVDELVFHDGQRQEVACHPAMADRPSRNE